MENDRKLSEDCTDSIHVRGLGAAPGTDDGLIPKDLTDGLDESNGVPPAVNSIGSIT